MNATAKRWTWIGSLALVGLITFFLFLESVAAGTVKAGYLGGRYTETLTQGFHFPVNPLVSWKVVDCRSKTIPQDNVDLPTADQQTSHVDISVQFRAVPTAADTIISGTGSLQSVVDVHLIPKIRSVIRNSGRTIDEAETLFNETEMTRIAAESTDLLSKFMLQKGVIVEAVLIRSVKLPSFIQTAIEKKKVREQQAEEQIAELERFETEQQQRVKQAQAELDAARLEAQKIQALADAEAYRINTVNAAVAEGAGYIQVETLRTFQSMSSDPAAKLYFMGDDGLPPLPFLNLGDK